MTESAVQRRPAWILSRRQAARIVVLGYVAMVALQAGFLTLFEWLQGDDVDNLRVAAGFAVVMLVPFGWALVGIFRRAKLPKFPALTGDDR